eukprot:CAMPEP_0113485152 /NCGR_PEP_ID=MMETSP0014_2-20120614/24336_1 /TAXON_ID=2857 /ORGANISM="Nitzschia sp." /LENGTH=408 /DNA_ID=CAMNT_0000378789 /DNA_START=66 /DNA_END=1292 /DNA_ORIENTATION=- /assembly_acc=CAM_ASM_000159
MVDATERLEVLLSQEANTYRTTDYLTRIHEQQEELLARAASAAAVDMEWEEEGDRSSPSSSNNSSGRADAASSPSSPKKRKSSCDDDEIDLGTATTAAAATAEQRGPSSERDGRQAGQSAAPGAESATSNSSLINKHWREKICEWAYQVVDHFDLNREVVSIAMNHLDRYLGSYQGTVDKNLFQLLAMTCLYMSIKLNEYKHLLIPGSKSSMDTILQLSRGFFTLEEMEKMELNVLNGLGWHVHPPTPQVFVKHFLFFLAVEEHEIHDLAQFMVELSIMDYFFVAYKPSEIALASLLNAVDRLCPPGMVDRIRLPVKSQYLDLNSPEVAACRARLALIYAQANEPAAMPNDGYVTPSGTTKVVHPGVETRTVSPVSVMATPHVAPTSSSATPSQCGMEATQVHSSWCT